MGMFGWLFRKRAPAPPRPPAASAPTAAPSREVSVSSDVPARSMEGSTGEDLWAQAMEATNSNHGSEAQRLFGLAIKVDPWRFCGIGRGSWKPAKPHQQSIWLQAMRDVGLQDVAAAIMNPPPPSELTIVSMMAADDKLEDILNTACAKSGWSRPRRASESVPSAASAPLSPVRADVEPKAIATETGCRTCGRELVFSSGGGLGNLSGVFSGNDFLSAARGSMSHSRACRRCRKNFCTACSMEAGKKGTAYYACPDCGAGLGNYGDQPTRSS